MFVARRSGPALMRASRPLSWLSSTSTSTLGYTSSRLSIDATASKIIIFGIYNIPRCFSEAPSAPAVQHKKAVTSTKKRSTVILLSPSPALVRPLNFIDIIFNISPILYIKVVKFRFSCLG